MVSFKGDLWGHLVSPHDPACDGADQGSEMQPKSQVGPDWELATPWTLRPESKTDTSQVRGLRQVIAPLSRPPEWAFQDHSTRPCLFVPMGKTEAQ